MKRILPYLLFFLCLGIIFSHMITPPCMVMLVIVFSLVCAIGAKRSIAAFFPIMMLVGCILSYSADTDPFYDLLLDNAAEDRSAVSAEGTIGSIAIGQSGFVYKISSENITLESGEATTFPYGLRLITPFEFHAGDRIKIIGRIYSHKSKFNPSDFDSKLYLKIHGYDYSFYCDDENDKYEISVISHSNSPLYAVKNKMYALRSKVNGIFDKYFDKRQSGILRSIITGDRSGIDPEDSDIFRNAGIYHFLAISGLHISVIIYCLVFVFDKLGRRKTGYLFTAVFLILYWLAVGSGTSVTRAVIMAYILIIGRLIGKRYDLINSASAAACIMLFADPLLIYDTGFLYSFSAVFGIAVMNMHTAEKHSPVVDSAKVSFGATLFSRIITVLTFYTVNLYDIIINLILILPLSAIVAVAFIFAAAALFIPNVELLALPLKFSLDLLFKISGFLSEFSVVAVGRQSRETICLIFICVLIFVLLMLHKSKTRMLALLFSAVLVCVVSTLSSDKGVSVNFLYVGKGDCCVIKNDDSAYIVDCGGNQLSDIGKDTGRYRIMPFLDYSRIKAVKGVFISHTDADHLKGLFDMIGKTKIENIYIAKYAEENDNYKLLLDLAAKNDIPITRLSPKDCIKDDKLSFTCLFPYEYNSKSNNDNSMVLLFEHSKNNVLFTGDIEQKSELALLDRLPDTDILKVAHHGSKTSTSAEFLDKITPEKAVISNSKRPAAATLDKLKKRNIETYMTYDGMVAFKSDENGFTKID